MHAYSIWHANIKMKLPEKFKTQMQYLLGEEYDSYIECLNQPMFHALRVNESKISVSDFLKISPFKLTPVPWCKNGFYYDEAVDKPSKHPYYYAGLYYLQEPSAMTPASMIPISPYDKVLDICAAPGGKSTELASRLNGTGYLISNDISASRAKALLKNLEVFGVDNCTITCEAPNALSSHFTNYFDKILIDAPCSGEGMFRKSQSMITAWEQNGNEMFASIQKGILNEVVKMLKPGGVILYSTCTFSPLENEKSIEYLLSLDSSLSLMPVTMYDGFVAGRPDWSDSKNPDLAYTAHLFPHKINGEGHFIALIKKNEEEDYASSSEYIPKKCSLTDEVKSFLKMVNKDFQQNRFEINNDKLYYIKPGCPDIKGLRILRHGLLIGELKKNRFEPSQAFAMSLKKGDFENTLNLSATDDRVIRYLKGETIECDSVKDGYVLIMVDGYSLGFGKAKNGNIKNKYLPGWRMM